MPSHLVLPSQIPLADLRGRDLEQCLFWLVDSIGDKDLEWRHGGSSGGASDGGRDLEATFQMAAPDGEVSRQKWWIEAKGRAKTVEAEAVKTAVHNARGKLDLDVLIIATNSVFSNPTRDWLSQWQASEPRSMVRLWDRERLEQLLSQHSEVDAARSTPCEC